MTANQIAYMGNLERIRDNMVNEGNNLLGITNNYLVASRNTDELIRHNRTTEGQTDVNLRQTMESINNDYKIRSRANTIAEVNAISNSENAATNRINSVSNTANATTNLLAQKETERNNTENNQIGWSNLQLQTARTLADVFVPWFGK